MYVNIVFANTNVATPFLIDKRILIFFPSPNSSLIIVPNLILLGYIILIFSCLVIILVLVVSAWTHFCKLVIVFLFKIFQYILGPRWKSFNGKTNNHFGFIKSVQEGAEPTKLKKEAGNLLHSSLMILLIPLRGKIFYYYLPCIFFPLLLGLDEL